MDPPTTCHHPHSRFDMGMWLQGPCLPPHPGVVSLKLYIAGCHLVCLHKKQTAGGTPHCGACIAVAAQLRDQQSSRCFDCFLCVGFCSPQVVWTRMGASLATSRCTRPLECPCSSIRVGAVSAAVRMGVECTRACLSGWGDAAQCLAPNSTTVFTLAMGPACHALHTPGANLGCVMCGCVQVRV